MSNPTPAEQIRALSCPAHEKYDTWCRATSAAAQLAEKWQADHAAHVERLENLYRAEREKHKPPSNGKYLTKAEVDYATKTEAALTKTRTG